MAVDPAAAAEVARREGLTGTDPAELSRQPFVLSQVERVVAETNAKLPPYARIKRFAVLSAELSEAAEEVTPTQKLRRKRIGDKYVGVLEDLYRRPASTVSPATSPAGAP